MKKNCIKIIKNNIDFIIIFIVSIIIFIPFINVHYATDTYYIMNKGYINYAVNNSFKDGRFVMAIISEIAGLFNIPINIYISVLTILAIFTSCITVKVLKNIFLKNIENKSKLTEILVLIFSYFTIFNFMFIENMHFVECFVMALSILMYLLSAKVYVDNEKNYILKTSILLLMGLICYQGTFSMYLISLTVLLIIKKEPNTKKLIEFFLGGILAIIAITIQFILIKLVGNILQVQQIRISNINGIKNNILTIAMNGKDVLINTGFVFPKYLYLLFLLIITFVSVINYRNKQLFCEQILIILFAIIFGLSISAISSFGFWSARIRYSIGTTIGFMFLHIINKTNLSEMKNKLDKLLIIIFIIYGIITVSNYIHIMQNAILVNIKDNEVAVEICNYVREYEKNNNVKIKKLALIPGQGDFKAFYPELDYKNSVLSWSAIRTSWAIEELIEENLKIDLIQTNLNNEQYHYYIDNVNMEKEYLCIDDILIISYYIN